MAIEVPDLERLEGTIRDVSPLWRETPYAAQWWQRSLVSRIPENAVGWMVAQGWQVTDSFEEDDEQFYIMVRDSMNSWKILQSLLIDYTAAYNEGRKNNSIRYNDVVSFWVDAINRAGNHLDTVRDVSDANLALYVTEMDASVAEIQAEMILCTADATAAASELATQLSQYLTKLDALEGIYDTHEAVAEAFLVDLGVAETARINEQFDSALAKNLQALTDRGMYSSYLITSVTARIERERSEALTQLNDRLAREKLENEHTLYEQERVIKGMVLDGRVTHNNALMQKAQFVIQTRKDIALTVMQARMARMSGRMDIRDRQEKLMAYQLDTHNNLAIGLWNFIERRDDEYPSMESITKLVAGLGDAGGAWVTP